MSGPTYSSINDTLLLENCHIVYIEHVLVTVKYKSAYHGDIELYLESPSGTYTTLFAYETFCLLFKWISAKVAA